MDNTDRLPPSVAEFAEYLAMRARGSSNGLPWYERSKFKADLMNTPQRWTGVDPAAFATKLRAEGMREEDISVLIDLLVKAQAGRRLVPHHIYRTYRFGSAPEEA